MEIINGKLQFSKGDVFDYSTLSEIIEQWLKDFKEDYVQSGWGGVNSRYLEQVGVGDLSDIPDEKLEEAQQLFLKDLDELIWTFGEHEPDPTMEYEDWIDAMWEYEKRRGKGLRLFGEVFTMLWN